jgi:Glu-tRNA(Gln) amidotransferase subunit E-like FAD-binding protein
MEVRIGLEVHQQLNTKKLFCNCPSLIKENEKPDLIIKRNLFAVSGELGKIDIAALYESEKKKNYYYYFYKDCCCLVELDEMPPLPINQEALKTSIQISLLLNAKILPLTQVMRKIVIDGSDVTGFQRTMLLAENGFLDYEFNGKKRIKIKSICLEEEAAKKIKEEEGNVYYSLDRYGIPLVEIATEASIKDPEEAKVVALKIGEVLRACNVKRGIGTIRQDLNVSVEGGARTEIKGVQEPKLIPIVLKNEIEWQIEKIKKGEKIFESVKKANEDGSLSFLRPLPTSARMYPETDLPLIKIDEKIVEEIKKNLPLTIEKIRKEIEELENKDFIEILAKERERFDIYKEIVEELKIEDIEDKKFVASIMVNYVNEIKRERSVEKEKLLNIIRKNKKVIEDCLKGEIAKAAIKEIIKKLVDGYSYEKIKEEFRVYSREELKRKIKEFLEKEKIDEPYIMQETIKKFKFNADISSIVEVVKEIMKKK